MHEFLHNEGGFAIVFRAEQDLVRLRNVAERMAEAAGLEELPRTRFVTTAVEVASCVMEQGDRGEVCFGLLDRPARLVVEITTSGSMPRIFGAMDPVVRDLLAETASEASGPSDCVQLEERLPAGVPLPAVDRLREEFAAAVRAEPGALEQSRRQNRQALCMLQHLQLLGDQLRAEQKQKLQLSRELQETNQGVMALYSELDEKSARLEHLNETLEHRVAERTAEVERRSAQLRALAAELDQTEQRERRRFAQLLHDHLQQLLYAVRLKASILRRRIKSEDVLRLIEQMDDLLDQSIEASRSLTLQLSPPVVYDAGLPAALEWLSREMSAKQDLRVDLDLDPAANPVADDIRNLLFQATRELLFNVVKHARSNRALIKTGCDSTGRILVTVADEGIGFDPRRLQSRRASAAGFGLFSIRERLEYVDRKSVV